jgi:iron complex outermembrane receptor protein
MKKRNTGFAQILGTILAMQLVVSTVQADQQPAKTDAQEDSNLGQTIVTATRNEHDVDTAPGSVEVVTKREIEKKNALTVDEALKGCSGVMTSRSRGLTDSLANITLRGVPSQSRTLVMVDGVAMNSPFAGNVQTNGIGIGTLERIEVVKGASSSLYGGNAMGGVVNLIP